jgi:hypothetical protein
VAPSLKFDWSKFNNKAAKDKANAKAIMNDLWRYSENVGTEVENEQGNVYERVIKILSGLK